MSQLLILFSILFSMQAHAVLTIPSNLNDGEQQLVLQTLGIGTSFRPVNNPYPMGGYSGFEFGLSAQSVPTADIAYYGSRASIDRNVVYPLINIGKGIFDNIDLMFSFVPYNESSGLGIYSGALRWSFFQATFVPASFSLLVHGSSTNFNNLFAAQTTGAELITGVNVDPFSIYIGAGTIYGQGQFTRDITLGNVISNQTTRVFHSLIGLNVDIAQFFTAFEIDVYSTTIFSLKFGTRL